MLVVISSDINNGDDNIYRERLDPNYTSSYSICDFTKLEIFEKTSNKKNGNGEVLHQGISKRYFERSFTIADDVKVLGAELKDGLLTVSLERIIPEEKKEKVIEIK